MDSNKARQKIKAHIKRCGNQSVTITPKTIKYWWNVCNDACFDGQLQMPIEFILNDWQAEEGEEVASCIPVLSYKPDVRISIQMRLESRTTFLTLLIHEMVHQWEWEMYRLCGHGKRFYSWSMFIEKELGLTLSQYVDVG